MQKIHILIQLLFIINSAKAIEIEEFDSLKWIKIDSAIEQTTIKHLKPPILGDGEFFILRFIPNYFNFDLIEFKQNNKLETANYWTDSMGYSVVFNAGMYNLNNEKLHRFYMQNKGLINNNVLDTKANGIIAFNPLKNSSPNFKLFDLTITDFNTIKNEFGTIIQGYRLIDGNGKPVIWDRDNQICSMIVIAQDHNGYAYVIFSRSPLSQNQMIENLVALNLGLNNAIYLEGGSKASLSILTKDIKLKKVGSYVSNYYPFDNNHSMPKFPNFIGFKLN
jgi:hypothetical protein